jgi:menaquinone-dependent protoporphyrinogen IX oxidase
MWRWVDSKIRLLSGDNMKKILIAYATNAGSTADVADVIQQAITNKDIHAEVKSLDQVNNLDVYDAVIIGAPMILGWHRDARRFLRVHRAGLAAKPFACFLTAMSLTETRETTIDGVPIQVDPGLAKAPRNPKRLSIKESYALPRKYVRPILKSASPAKPLGVGLFGGYLNLFTLSWPARLFVLLAIQAKPGDLRDDAFIKAWALELRAKFIKNWLK